MLRALRAMINAHAQLSYRSCLRLCIEGVLHCALIRHLENVWTWCSVSKRNSLYGSTIPSVSGEYHYRPIHHNSKPVSYFLLWVNELLLSHLDINFCPWFYIHNYIAPYKFVYTKTLLLQNVIIYALNRGFTIPWIISSGIIGGSHLEYPLYSFNVQYAHFESCRARVVNGNAGTIDHQPCKEHPSGTWYNIHSDFNSCQCPSKYFRRLKHYQVRTYYKACT